MRTDCRRARGKGGAAHYVIAANSYMPGAVLSGFCILAIKSPSTQGVCGRAWFEATDLAPEWTPEAHR